MSGGFKWIEIGSWQAIADDEGKILAHIVVGPKNNPVPGAVGAFVDGKFLGNYLTDKYARAAVEEAMSVVRQNAGSHAGRVCDTDVPEVRP